MSIVQTIKKIILIGGSAGSVPLIFNIMSALPARLKIPIIIVLHRHNNVVSEFAALLKAHAKNICIMEPDDKQPLLPANIYLAPQNYHLLIEQDCTFSLDYSELVNYSRPSIDVTFESAAHVFGKGVTGILLSGANGDGSAGMKKILEYGGEAWVQEPVTAEYPTMPQRAIELNPLAQSMTPKNIVSLVSEQQLQNF